MDPLLNIAYRAARKAEKAILQHLNSLKDTNFTEKGHHDVVTEIDLRSEGLIISTIKEAFPDHNILSEEAGHQPGDPNQPLWIIDPLDGTTNFLHGFPHFCISIAVMENQRIEYGLIYDPIRSELFTARRGNGAYLNERRIRVSGHTVLEGALIGMDFPHYHKEAMPRAVRHLEKISHYASGLRHTGSAALGLAYVAAGRLDAYFEAALKIWDIAAGALLVKEAGGIVCDFSGAETYLDTGYILAAPPKILKQLLPIVAEP